MINIILYDVCNYCVFYVLVFVFVVESFVDFRAFRFVRGVRYMLCLYFRV